jgi:sugar lactone lactonase YvrE
MESMLMNHKISWIRTRTVRLMVVAVAAVASISTASADGQGAYLARFNSINLVASTVPANGDVNPYGIAVVPASVGNLKAGSILVSNFNDSTNLQGTGSTIMQIAPDGSSSLFAQIGSAGLPAVCPGGIGLTTALSVLRRGWVIVGSLPTTDGTSATAQAGCLLVLDSMGKVVDVWAGSSINGPWDMTALDQGANALLFVTNVLNGDVTSGSPHVVNQGTVLRIAVNVPHAGSGTPKRMSTTVIGSKFPETADPDALVIGPTGVGLGTDGTLYVADSVGNRIAAIPQAVNRKTSAGTGHTLSIKGGLNDPLGVAIAPNGHVLAANGNDGNLVEITPGGKQVNVKTVETATGAGSLFGIAIVPGGNGVYFVDDGDNTMKVLTGSSGGSGS